MDFSALLQENALSLSNKDLRMVLRIIDRVQQTASMSHFLRHTHEALLEAIPADGLILAATRFRAGMRAVSVDMYGQPAFTKEHYAYYSRHALEHPTAKHFVETANCSAVRVSDLMPTEQWIKTRFWKTCLAWIDYRYEMLAVWPLGRNSIFNMTFNRVKKDFSERDKNLFNAVLPFIGRQYQMLTRLSNARTSLKKTKQTNQSPLAPDTALLTPREQEIFQWLGEGKDNREIATILNLSLRTVQKHVENILRKLRLENRYAAAAMASLTPNE